MKQFFKNGQEKIKKMYLHIRLAANNAISNNRGEMYMDVLFKILMVVVIGALLLGLAKIAIPDLFSNMMEKVKALLTI